MTELKQRVHEKVLKLPYEPGVYIMMDASHTIIYVGKAKSLKNRVSQYFHDSASHSPKTRMMVSQIADFDTIVTDTEFEALLLECSLIKRHKPKYNILLKDDKGYPFIRLSVGDEYPRFTVVGKKADDGARYFGPYSGRSMSFEAINTVCVSLGLPTCRKVFPRDIGRDRPCLNHHMGKCLAVCAGRITRDEYMELIAQAIQLFEGKQDGLEDELRNKMESAAEALEFERAARLRDRLAAVKRLKSGQKILSGAMADTDFAAYFVGSVKLAIAIVHYRDGVLISREVELFDYASADEAPEKFAEYIGQYYIARDDLPKEIYLSASLPEMDDFGKYLSEKCGHRVRIAVPERGEKAALVRLAANNAKEAETLNATKEARRSKLCDLLGHALGIPAPHRIEAYDISNNAGTDIVGAMTVFVDAEPSRKDYRLFRIKGLDAQDDYGSMREVLTRRFTHYLEGDAKFSERPDLLLIDGGSVHAKTVVEALATLGITDIPVYGMVKDDRHRTRAIASPDGGEIGIVTTPALFAFIGRIQEETHRRAIGFQTKVHGKASKKSELEGIEGVGKARREALLKAFRSVNAIKNADLTELSAVLPANVASAVYRHFHP